MAEYLQVTTTAGSEEEAEQIGTALIGSASYLDWLGRNVE
jgi:hypothetical protein